MHTNLLQTKSQMTRTHGHSDGNFPLKQHQPDVYHPWHKNTQTWTDKKEKDPSLVPNEQGSSFPFQLHEPINNISSNTSGGPTSGGPGCDNWPTGRVCAQGSRTPGPAFLQQEERENKEQQCVVCH